MGRRADRGGGPARRAIVLAAAADGAVGQSAWRVFVRPGADSADRARCRVERGYELAKIAGAALGRIRARGIDAELLHALWLEFAAGNVENSRTRRRAAADHGVAAGGVRQHRRAGDMPAFG